MDLTRNARRVREFGGMTREGRQASLAADLRKLGDAVPGPYGDLVVSRTVAWDGTEAGVADAVRRHLESVEGYRGRGVSCVAWPAAGRGDAWDCYLFRHGTAFGCVGAVDPNCTILDLSGSVPWGPGLPWHY